MSQSRPEHGLGKAEGMDDSMRFPWDGLRAPKIRIGASLRTTAIAALTASGSVVLDVALAERAPVEVACHALLVGLIAGALSMRDRERVQLAWDATHDALTGLFNRRGLKERFEAMRAAGVDDLAVVYVDLDHFKKYNDAFGHAMGDRLLVAIARALASTRPTDVAARLGGDELVLLMPRADLADAERALARVRDRFSRDACTLGMAATFSAGIRVVDGAASLEQILSEADRAMYVAKRESRRPVAAQPAMSMRRARKWVCFAALIAASALATQPHASAQDVMEDRAAMIVHKPPAPPPAPPAPVHVELLGGTLAPIDFELAARIVVLDRFIVGVAAGLTMYGGVAGSIVDQNGGNGAGSIVATLSLGAFVFRAYAGFRPFEGLGLEIVGGYALVTQSTDVDVGGIAQALGAQTSATSGHAAFTLHAATVELAWSFYVLDDFIIRPSIGWMQVLGSDVAISSPTSSAGLSDASTALESALLHYGMTPTVSLSLGYRF